MQKNSDRSRAAKYLSAGRIWPAGRSLPTPALRSKHSDRLRDVTSRRESLLPARLLRVKAAPEDVPGEVVLSYLELKPMSHICGVYKRAI